MRLASTTLALLLCLALACHALWPAPLDGGVVVGHWSHSDALSNHWLLVWVAERLWAGEDLVHNEAYYWPVGDYPFLAGNGGEGVVASPFHLVFGWPLGVSVYALAVLTANGMAAWWGARCLGASSEGALVAAAGFGVSAYVVQEMGCGRFSQADVTPLALSLGWLGGVLRAPERQGAASGALGGLLFGLTSVLYWYYGVFFGIAALALGLPFLGAGRRLRARVAWAFLATAALVVAGPLAWFLHHWDRIVGTGEVAGFPHPMSLQDAVQWTLPVAVDGTHPGLAVSVVVLLLASWAVVRASRERRLLQVVQLGCLVLLAAALAGGPRLALGPIPSPYEALYGLSATLRRFWWPSRHLVLVHWGVSMLAALGASALLADRSTATRGVSGVGLALAVPVSLALAGDLVRIPLSRFEVPEFYERVRDLPAGVVAEVPLSPRLSASQQMLIYQLIHRKPLLLGHAPWVDRVRPDDWDAHVSGNGVLSSWMAWEEGQREDIAFAAEDLLALRGAGLRWMVLNREYVPIGMHTAYHQALVKLFGTPVIGTNRAKAWDLERWTGLTRLVPPPHGIDLEPGDGTYPATARRPESLGFHLHRDFARPAAGLYPARWGHRAAPTRPGP